MVQLFFDIFVSKKFLDINSVPLYFISINLSKKFGHVGDFSETLQYAGADTFFYFDPPYKPLSDTSSFNTYVKEPFDDAEQIRLRDFVKQISARGSQFILSNSDVKGKNPEDDFFDELYKDFIIRRVFASRMVNANPEKRGKLTELMITNIKPYYRIEEQSLMMVSEPETIIKKKNYHSDIIR